MNTSKLIEAVFGGLTMILIGFVLLLNTMGTLPWTVWAGFIYLWPLFLIMGGLALLIPDGALNKFVTGAMSLLVFAAIFTFGYINYSGTTDWTDIFAGIHWLNVNANTVTEETTFPMPAGTVDRINLTGELSKGTMLIHESHDQEDFIVANSEHYQDGAGRLEIAENPDFSNTEYYFIQSNPFVHLGGSGKRNYDISLAEAAVPMYVDWKVVSGKFTADIHHNTLGDSKLEVVSGNAEISLLKWVDDSTLTVKLVAGKISLVLPDSSDIKVNYKIVGGSLDVEDQQYSGLSNGSVTVGDSDGDALTVNIEVVAGNAEIILADPAKDHAE